MSIRNAAKAIIVKDNKVLLNQCYMPDLGEYFALPGGGQNQYETMEEAVVRECLEETGYTVIPQACIALYEQIHESEAFRRQHPDYSHKIFHIFRCTLADTPRKVPTETDAWQQSSVWVDIADVSAIPLLPECIREHFERLAETASPVYLGTEIIS
ncbi:MAG TPA: NUDIX domain-containing protein [Candidatus Limiplasma sp.]|nr:NUDIX domain-containing protein [Candidatus Limiplasma sp.]